MKKILAALLLICVAFGASAKFRWGPTVGVNFNTWHWKQKLITSEMLPGFNAGVMGEVMIPGIGFGIDFAVRYSMMGGKVYFVEKEVWASSGIGTTDLYMHTLQIPLNLRFKWTRMNGIENYIAPFVYGGPVFNFHLAHSKCEAVENPLGSVGLRCALVAEVWKRYQISFGYNWDVTYDVRTKKLDNFSARSEGWFIDAAILF